MLVLKQKVAAALEGAIISAFGASEPKAADIAEMLEYPPDAAMGDLAFPCFKLSRILRMGPPQIAAKLAQVFSCEEIARIEVAGGYLNLFLSPAAFALRVLGEIDKAGDLYGSPNTGAGKTVVLDYSSPNVAKPFHIGHLGTTVIGHSLKLLYEFAGYTCIGINHLGDWGTQFGKLIVAYRRWGSREEIEKGEIDALVGLYVRFHAEAEADPSLGDEARAEFAKLEAHDEENISLWKWFIEISLREYEKTYRQLGISFDSYNGESFYTDKMPRQIEVMREKNLLTLDDGASVVRLDDYGMPVCLILKRDGSTLYPTRDIAAAVYRKETYDFDKCIYVTSAGQSLHFAQWFKVIELMGYDFADKLVHVPYGTVSINGAKLATRTGNVVLLKDLFAQAIEKAAAITAEKNPNLTNKEEVAEAVGVGAIVFHYLSGNRIKDINFVLEDALSFDGNTGPYAQYTYARTASILEKAEGVGQMSAYEMTAQEIGLVKTLATFPEAVASALSEHEPFHITRYILDLCAAFNRFYHECQILSCPDTAVRDARVAMTAATHTVLGRALTLICMKKTEKI